MFKAGKIEEKGYCENESLACFRLKAKKVSTIKIYYHL